jgi:hypothetical protein
MPGPQSSYPRDPPESPSGNTSTRHNPGPACWRLCRHRHNRHTFAIQALLRWYSAGAAVKVKLPLLPPYMGHVSITPRPALRCGARTRRSSHGSKRSDGERRHCPASCVSIHEMYPLRVRLIIWDQDSGRLASAC